MSELAPGIENREKTAQLAWTGFILVFFLIQAVIWTIAVSVVASNRSHAVVSGYDEKALKWDEQKALQLASLKLGWQVEFEIESKGDIFGNRKITLKVNDAKKQPVTKANVQLTALHPAYAAEPQDVSFSESENGVYIGSIQVRKSGRWKFEGMACRGADTYLIKHQEPIETE